MKIKKSIVTSIILIFTIVLVICLIIFLKKASNPETEAAKQTVKNYFLYYNQKNKDKVLSCVNHSYLVRNVNNLDNIQLLKIQEADNNIVHSYLKSQQKRIKIKRENFKVFLVRFKVKFKDNVKAPIDSGEYEWYYTVIRKDNNSPWLIESYGLG